MRPIVATNKLYCMLQSLPPLRFQVHPLKRPIRLAAHRPGHVWQRQIGAQTATPHTIHQFLITA